MAKRARINPYWKKIKLTSKQREERRLRQTKRLNLFLFCVVVVGLMLSLFHFIGRYKGSDVSIDFADRQSTIRTWKQSGFVKSMDDTAGTLVMNEALWNKLSTPQKESVVILLRAFYAERSGTKESKLIIKGDLSQKLLVSREVVSISGKLKPLHKK
jgi:hypothetical protein